jgi:hypothetical protein
MSDKPIMGLTIPESFLLRADESHRIKRHKSARLR